MFGHIAVLFGHIAVLFGHTVVLFRHAVVLLGHVTVLSGHTCHFGRTYYACQFGVNNICANLTSYPCGFLDLQEITKTNQCGYCWC